VCRSFFVGSTAKIAKWFSTRKACRGSLHTCRILSGGPILWRQFNTSRELNVLFGVLQIIGYEVHDPPQAVPPQLVAPLRHWGVQGAMKVEAMETFQCCGGRCFHAKEKRSDRGAGPCEGLRQLWGLLHAASSVL
jgi:hypothetical protein